MPYLDFYLRNIDCKKNEVSVVYWNRDLKEENIPYEHVKFYEFRAKLDDDDKKFFKIYSFIKYKHYASKFLRKNFDRVIVLHSLPGVLNWRILTKKYKERFIFDFRDLTYESIPIYKKIIASLVKCSAFTSVSSDGFRPFLPKECGDKIYTNHNILEESLFHRDCGVNRIKSSIIRIAFWGFIREERLNKQIIKSIAGDRRFELHYYGREQQIALNLKKYAKDIGTSNIFFHGAYIPEDRYKFVQNTDLIHNIYSESKNVMLAMGNKFYDGIIFYLPQICMQGSFMGEIVEKEKLGFAVDPYSERFLDSIYERMKYVDEKNFKNTCNQFLHKCQNEIKDVKEKLHFELR